MDTVGFIPHMCIGNRVCAILGEAVVEESSAWHHETGHIGDHVNASETVKDGKERARAWWRGD